MEPQPMTSIKEERSAAETFPVSPRPSAIRSGNSIGYARERRRTTGSTWTTETAMNTAATLPSNDSLLCDDPPARKRGRPKVNDAKVRESLLEVGSPVYAPFPGKNPSHEPYYWGTVTKKTLNRERAYMYNIDFDDGDKLCNFSSQYLFRMEEILQEFMRGDLKVLLKPPKRYVLLWNSKRDGPAPIEYFQNDSSDRCTQCWQCTFLRQRCGNCVLCRQSKELAPSSQRHKHACIQTMCIEGCKVQSQTYGILPPTWSFYFDDPNDPKNSDYHGLWIIKDNVAKKWKNFENAQRSAHTQFCGYSKRKFYKFVGLETNVHEKTDRPTEEGGAVVAFPRSVVVDVVSTLAQRKKTKLTAIHNAILPLATTTPRPSFQKNSLTLSVLYSNRCRICWMCTREPCQKCHACVINKGRTLRHPNVCFRKMCEQFQEDEKKQAAQGFDPGWTFYFSSPPYGVKVDHQDLKGLTILSPSNERFTNVEIALEHCFGRPIDLEQEPRQQFYNHIGASLIVPIPKSVLLGKSFFKEWIRVDGSKVFLIGQVTQVMEDTITNKEVFTVTYDEESRFRLNRSNHGKLHVPASWNFLHHDAWDGCLRSFEVGSQPNARFQPFVPYCERWVTPNTYSKHMLPAQGTLFPGYSVLPCVEITYRGYLVTFTVKKSTILQARFGVFLSIRPLVPSSDLATEFRLPVGTLLDFGVYAPFRMEDVRGDHEHFIKSMIHSYKNEVYCFNGRDHEFYLDITDDWTGELHALARRHIPPFVNEIQDPEREIPAVHARLDPEGALHYLLGHPELEQGDFCFMADSSEEEIFVDYGPEYEMVRLREKYPRIVLDEDEAERRLLVETCEYVEELNTFTAAEVQHFIKSYVPILSQSLPPSKKILIRIIAVTMLLKRRAAAIHEEFFGLRDDESICDNGVRVLDMDLLLSNYEQMLLRACNAWENNYGSFQDMYREAKECDLFLVAFAKIWPLDSLESLTPKGFVDRITSSLG